MPNSWRGSFSNLTPNAMNDTTKTHEVDCPHCDYEMQFDHSDVDEYGEVGCEYCHSDLYVGDICPNIPETNKEESKP